MNKFLRISFITFHLLLLNKQLSAQSYLDLSAAQVFSTFRFTSINQQTNNSNTTFPNYTQLNTNAFGIGYTYVQNKGLLVLGGLGFRKAGANMVYKATDYQWNLQYIDVKIGGGYQYDKWRVKPFATITPYYAYLLNAKQTVGLNYYDIKTTKSIKPYDLGLFLSGGIKVALSPYILLYSQYDYNLGLKNIETGANQYLYNRGFAIKLGLIFSITNFKTMQDYIAKTEQGRPQENPDEEQQLTQSNTIIANQASPNNNKVNNKANTEEKITTPGTVGWTNTPKTTTKPTSTENQNNNSTTDNKQSATLASTSENQNTSTSNNNTNVNNSQHNNILSTPTENNNQKSSSPKEKKDKIEFKIQITSVKNSLDKNHQLLKKANGNILAEKGKDGWTRYYIGSYDSYDEAKSELIDIKKMGYSNGSFVVAFKNGKKITVAEAKALLK